jgi:3-hydroxybutyryl-CoA dehydrogenase
VQTLNTLTAPKNIYRINGWTTFLNRSVWEIAGTAIEEVESIFKPLNVKINFVKDEPGFIAARVIAMIINEAYFALEEEVSTKKEMDIAMKLGTNYPYGPFEWAGIIGLSKIATLLQILFLKDERYTTAPALLQELAFQNTSN